MKKRMTIISLIIISETSIKMMQGFKLFTCTVEWVKRAA